MKASLKLGVQALLITLVFFLVLSATIFIAAGSLSFWQGWLCIACFCLPTLIITVYFLFRNPALIQRRIAPKETRLQQQVGQLLAGFLFFAGFWVLPGLDYRYSWSRVPFVATLIAGCCIVIGFVVVFAVFKANTYTSKAIEVTKGQQVITQGPYAIVRHPMYSGAILIILGMPLALDSIWGILPAFMLIIFVVMRLLDEEKLLRKELAGYNEYCEKTRQRIVPYVW